MSVKRFLDKYFSPSDALQEQPSPFASAPVPVKSLVAPPSPAVTTPRTFHIFTDGACSDNGRKGARGGFGVHFYSKKGAGLDISLPLMKNEQQTNNRGELRAIQAALDTIDKYHDEWSREYNEYCIWSDSEYSIHCLTKWAPNWKRNGWKKSDGGLIQNLDLVRPVYERIARMPYLRLQHVRAHQRGREHEFPFDGNTEADRLARASVVQPLFAN